jgi:hypothetical protein
VSELSELLAGIDSIKLRQSRAIARVIDRQRAAAEAGAAAAEDTGYDFAIAVVAAATDREAAEIEEMAGSILELGPAITRIMRLAGFASGDAPPGEEKAPGPPPGLEPRTGSGISMPPLPPAMATRLDRSAR